MFRLRPTLCNPRLEVRVRTYLGVDQSLRRTGLVVLNDDGDLLLRRPVATGQLRAAARLAAIRDALRAAVDEYKPVQAALEGYSYGSTGKVFQLGEVGGVLQLELFDAQVPFIVVTPAHLKKYVANNAQADKELMLRKAKEKWGIDFGDEDDVCDAYGLARILRALVHKDTSFRHELEVIHELTSPPKALPRVARAAKGKITVSV